jgi:hypothetical protein
MDMIETSFRPMSSLQSELSVGPNAKPAANNASGSTGITAIDSPVPSTIVFAVVIIEDAKVQVKTTVPAVIV